MMVCYNTELTELYTCSLFSIGVEVGFERVSYHVTESEGAVLQVCIIVMNSAAMTCHTRTPFSVITSTHDDSAGLLNHCVPSIVDFIFLYFFLFLLSHSI